VVWDRKAVDQLNQAVGQKPGAFEAKTGFAHIDGLQDPALYDVALVMASMMVIAVDLHNAGRDDGIFSCPRS
jgi:hypothetical protein